nr:MAG TPA: hypothetical protein [Caudoviricetes sp.]
MERWYLTVCGAGRITVTQHEGPNTTTVRPLVLSGKDVMK